MPDLTARCIHCHLTIHVTSQARALAEVSSTLPAVIDPASWQQQQLQLQYHQDVAKFMDLLTGNPDGWDVFSRVVFYAAILFGGVTLLQAAAVWLYRFYWTKVGLAGTVLD